MVWQPWISTRTEPIFPSTILFRSPWPFIVFFDWHKADVTPEAASILDNAAAAYQQTGQASVMLAGHADKSGSDQYNVGLSQRRAEAAKAYLAGKVVLETAISTEGFGESRARKSTRLNSSHLCASRMPSSA